MRIVLLSFAVALVSAGWVIADDPPRSRDPRLKIELFAEHPQIVTPTGIDADHAGRVWAIESNTHFRPQEYKGHPTDRLLVLSDTDGNGRADKIVTFADGFTHAMSIAVRPLWFTDVPQAQAKPKAAPATSGLSVYLATRREIVLLHDDDGDLKVDRQTMIARLDTKGVYPHNAINGLAFHPLGWLYFGIGENLGAAYKLIGSDGTTLSGGGEGGNMYRCRPDGSKLERIATGFWNPHASCFDAFGRLFSVDNDPDSRPPCRLLHVIPGGDYGYRYRNGRRGLHPFTSWNGEIPGTLPMVAGTGEAPAGIVAYESDGLPEEYLGNLLVTSWGDHRIDRFRLKPKGASFTSLAEPVIVGGENFRPVGLACAPDGSLYCTDWMLRDYNLHGHGRIWRIVSTNPRRDKPVDVARIPDLPVKDLGLLLNSKRLEVRRGVVETLSGIPDTLPWLTERFQNPRVPTRIRIEALWGLVRHFSKSRLATDDSSFYLRDDASPVASALLWATDESLFGEWGKPSVSFDEITWKNPAENQHPEETKIPKHEVDHTFPLAMIWSVTHRMVGIGDPISVEENLLIQDPFTFSMTISAIEAAWGKSVPEFFNIDQWTKPRARLGLLLAFRRGQPRNTERLKWFLKDRDADLRRALLQWIAEERLQEFRPQVSDTLNDPAISADLFMATLAALEMLDGVPPAQFDKTPLGKRLVPLVQDERRPAAVRALALRMVDSTDPALNESLLEKLLATNDPVLKLEAVRTLQTSPVPEAARLLRSIAADEKQDPTLRLEAIVGLARTMNSKPIDRETDQLLSGLLESRNTAPAFRAEALRAYRGHFPKSKNDHEKEAKQLALRLELQLIMDNKGLGKAEKRERVEQFFMVILDAGERIPKLDELRPKRPKDRSEWLALMGVEQPNEKKDPKKQPGDLTEKQNLTADSAAGRRIFYHPNSAGCYKCHTVNGRGGKVGPDLSTIGRALPREKLLDSILEPSREIAPQFITWSFETRQGKVHTGMIVHENEGRTVIGDAEGKTTELKTIDIVDRVPQKTSVMPEKLVDRLTVQELRDLLAFLESLK